MPVKVDQLRTLLMETNYDKAETEFLLNGFTTGFDIGYQGPKIRQSSAENIPFTPGVGDKTEMWNKIMKEVKAGRVAGPFDQIPFDNYIQSPIGLVPKKGKNKTRLIFHLSYDFEKHEKSNKNDSNTVEERKSLNACTPREICSVKYNNLDVAVKNCIEVSHLAKELNKSSTIFFRKNRSFQCIQGAPSPDLLYLLVSFQGRGPQRKR